MRQICAGQNSGEPESTAIRNARSARKGHSVALFAPALAAKLSGLAAAPLSVMRASSANGCGMEIAPSLTRVGKKKQAGAERHCGVISKKKPPTKKRGERPPPRAKPARALRLPGKSPCRWEPRRSAWFRAWPWRHRLPPPCLPLDPGHRQEVGRCRSLCLRPRPFRLAQRGGRAEPPRPRRLALSPRQEPLARRRPNGLWLQRICRNLAFPQRCRPDLPERLPPPTVPP